MTRRVYIGTDGGGGIRDMTPEEEAAFEAQSILDAQRAAAKEQAKPLHVDFATALERLQPAEFATLAQVRAADPRFEWWMLRAAAQGTINVLSPEFALARQAIVSAGFFTAQRFDEIFAP